MAAGATTDAGRGGADRRRNERTADEVIRDHLRLRAGGDLEGDLARNFAEDVVILHVYGVEHGHDGVRKSAGRLRDQLPDADFEYVSTQVFAPYAYLEWRARSERFRVIDGADTFVVRDGLIVMQSIHYTLEDGE